MTVIPMLVKQKKSRLLIQVLSFLIYLKQLTNEGANLMSFASYVVGYSELNEENKAREYLNKFYSYFNGPFQVNHLFFCS